MDYPSERHFIPKPSRRTKIKSWWALEMEQWIFGAGESFKNEVFYQTAKTPVQLFLQSIPNWKLSSNITLVLLWNTITFWLIFLIFNCRDTIKFNQRYIVVRALVVERQKDKHYERLQTKIWRSTTVLLSQTQII